MEKNDDGSENFGLYKDENFILKEQDIEKNCRDLIGKSSNNRSRAKDGLLGCIPQNKLYVSEWLLILKEVSFGKQKFFVSKPVSEIKYYDPGFRNNNHF